MSGLNGNSVVAGLNAGMADAVVSGQKSLVGVGQGGSGILWPGGIIVTSAHVVAGSGQWRGPGSQAGLRMGVRERPGTGRGGRRSRRQGRGRWNRRGRASAQIGSTVIVRLPNDPSVEDAESVSVEATVLAADAARDIAILGLPADGVGVSDTAASIGDSRALRPGDWVVAVGHPFGVAGAAAAGAVIEVGEGFGDHVTPGKDWIVTSARMRPGHSGGPLLDAAGRVIGVNTLMNGPRIGVAVPAHAVVDFVAASERARASTRAAVEA